MHARTFDFAIERVGLDEQAEPEAVEGGVSDAENQSVENVADERTEDRRALIGGPIEEVVRGERKKRELAEEPPENSIGEAPAHAGAVTTDIALK